MTRDEITVLLRAGPRLLAWSGIQQKTVAQALGLYPSEVSGWVHRRHAPKRVTPRGMRYLMFLAGLRRAEANQAAAARLLADNETRAGPEIWLRPPEGESGVGAGRGVG